MFSTSSIFNGIFKRDNRKKLFGGARIPNPKLYEYDIEGYYTELTTYIEDMKKKINEDTTINNFVKIFSLVCKGIHQNSN